MLRVTALLLAWSSTAQARPGAGTLADPMVVDAFPYVARGDTLGGGHSIDRYSCATQNEAGGERVYKFTLERASKVTAWVEQSMGVDVDVHILSNAQLSGRTASSCAARGDVIAEAELLAGEHLVVVDTFENDTHAGIFVLHLDAIGDAWNQRTIADGVTWRARRFPSLAGGPQVVNELIVGGGVEVRALQANGCQTVGAIGQAAGAVAGINGGYFDTTNCAPVSLLKASGVLVGRNASSTARAAFGMSPAKLPLIARIGGNADWPAAHEAHGGGPLLSVAGVAKNGGAAWLEEGFMSASFLGINPRSFAGFDAMGRVHLGSVDGRRASARGMSMDDLAAFVVAESIGDAINLDGGGSTTLWIAGALPNGVVNYPSDAGASESAAHGGARGVSGGLYVFAPAYNHPPRFQTQPATSADPDAEFSYDADAIDLDADDLVQFRLEEAPAGASLSSDGVVSWSATASAQFRLVAFDGRGGESAQAWTVTVGEIAVEDGGDAPDAALLVENDAGIPATDKSGGCQIGHRQGHGRVLVLLVIAIFLRRRNA